MTPAARKRLPPGYRYVLYRGRVYVQHIAAVRSGPPVPPRVTPPLPVWKQPPPVMSWHQDPVLNTLGGIPVVADTLNTAQSIAQNLGGAWAAGINLLTGGDDARTMAERQARVTA